MKNPLTGTAIASILALSAAAPGWAQVATGEQPLGEEALGENVDVVTEEEVNLEEWGYEGLYGDTWRATRLIEAPVFGAAGDEIGEVDNIIVNTDGRVEALVVAVGGFLDIGDTHIAVPWDEAEIEFGAGEEVRVAVPVDAENVENYDLYQSIGGEFPVIPEETAPGPRNWRISELLQDYVVLSGEEGEEGYPVYGWVENVLFNRDGKIEAVVVDPGATYAGAPGLYAYPFYGYGYGFYPGYGYYGLPYGQEEIAGAGLEPFEYGRLGEEEVFAE